MARAILIDEEEHKRIYRTHDGLEVTLELDEDFSEIGFYLNGERNESFKFKELENGDYKLIRMYTGDNLKGRGLGRAALEFFKDATDAKIYTSPNDGQVRDDQSHLTGDAPIFVGKMVEEGLIEEGEEPDGYEEEWE